MSANEERGPTDQESERSDTVGADDGADGRSSRPGYNKAMEILLDGDDDLVGLVAYALYKQSKRDWIVSYRRQYGRPPNDDCGHSTTYR